MSTVTEIVFADFDTPLQKEAVQLLGRCFPEYWEQLAQKLGRFPYDEVSFVAVADGKVVGHAGLMPFEVSDGTGGTCSFAGLASVAVAPEYRGQGSAAKLCSAAYEWAVKEKFAAVPLFTALGRVYASVGWQMYEAKKSCTLMRYRAENSLSVQLKSAESLSDTEKSSIIAAFENGRSFPGKVIRKTGTEFHSWQRVFGEVSWRWLVCPDGYALFDGDMSLLEFYGDEQLLPELLAHPALPEKIYAALPHDAPEMEALRQSGNFQIINDSPDVWHGEYVMIKAPKSFPSGFCFPSGDKF